MENWQPAVCAYNASPKAAQILVFPTPPRDGCGFFSTLAVLRTDIAAGGVHEVPGMARSGQPPMDAGTFGPHEFDAAVIRCSLYWATIDASERSWDVMATNNTPQEAQADLLAEEALHELGDTPLDEPDEYAEQCDYAGCYPWLEEVIRAQPPGSAIHTALHGDDAALQDADFLS